MEETLIELLRVCRSNGDTKIFLNYTNLTEIPAEVLQLKYLKELYLKRNLLSSLPNEINMMQSLERLYLDSNKLECIPESIGELKSLEFLELNRNEISTIPSSIGKLTQLKSLHLCQNYLQVLPPEIGKLRNLQTLNLMKNNLKELPKEIGNCENLTTLQIDSNEFQQLPIELLKLKNLQDISASRNYLQTLPFDLILDANDDLHLLPGSIIFLKNLRYLSLHGCFQRANFKIEIFDDFIKEVLKVDWLGDVDGSILPLQEICLRALGNVYCTDVEKEQIDRSLPSQLISKLRHPSGSCTICCQKLYVGFFTLIQKRNEILEICNSFLLLENSEIICKLIESIDVRFRYLFLFCSKKCKNIFVKRCCVVSFIVGSFIGIVFHLHCHVE